jgi:DNA repair protein RecO (recombination protein O)
VAIEKALGVVVRLGDYSETSQIVTFLTDTAGLVAAIAKGAKRPSGPTGGPLDMLTVNEIVFSTPRRGGLATLREARIVEQFPHLRDCVARYYAGLYFAELSNLFGAGSEGAPSLFNLLVESLRGLGQVTEDRLLNVVLFFEAHLLSLCGLRPNLGACARCGRAPRAKGVRLSLEDGGLLCVDCSGGTPIRAGSLAALKRVSESSLGSIGRLRLRRELLNDVSGVLSAAIILGCQNVPRMVRYVKGSQRI